MLARQVFISNIIMDLSVLFFIRRHILLCLLIDSGSVVSVNISYACAMCEQIKYFMYVAPKVSTGVDIYIYILLIFICINAVCGSILGYLHFNMKMFCAREILRFFSRSFLACI